MKTKMITLMTAMLLASILPLSVPEVCAQTVGVQYLCELGEKFYEKGAYDDALHEFKKALLLEPQNPTALAYVRKITAEKPDVKSPVASGYAQPDIPRYTSVSAQPEPVQYAQARPSRDEVISRTLDDLSRQMQVKEPEPAEHFYAYSPSYTPTGNAVAIPQSPTPQRTSYEATQWTGETGQWLLISGNTQMSMGVEDREDLVWKRSNFDLNEKNWRVLSNNAYDNRENTYDPMIYDRFNVNLDTQKNTEGFGFHTNITVDPWSFVGKADKMTIIGMGGDIAEIELKYWSNTGYTLNESVYTLYNGDSFNLPEIKVRDGETERTLIRSNWNNLFTIPVQKIHREFQPLRELWLDYVQDDWCKVRVFPFGLEDQAYTSDDPLRISNNRMFWEDSPWIRSWKPGNFNFNAAPATFTKGYWDNSLSYVVRDSAGIRLTQLRGASLALTPTEDTGITTMWATPKDPWQDYSTVDTVSGATRLKQSVGDGLVLGATHTLRFGLLEDNGKTDSRNNVIAADASFEPFDGVKTTAEVAYSKSYYDLTSPDFDTKARGNAYMATLETRYPGRRILNTAFGAIRRDPREQYMSKLRFFGAHMDQGFDPALSSYRQTRRDSFWSRHIYFRKPFDFFYQGLYAPAMGVEDLRPFAIGNGLDIGRDVLGLRWESSWRGGVDNLFDIRNVHTVEGKYVETVTRDELTWNVNDRLTAKALGIYQDMPKTTAGVDPFLYDSRTGENLTDWSSDPVEGGKDPSLKTGSVGLEYALTKWLSLNGVYEYTNDYTLAYDNYPRGNLNSAQPSYQYDEYGKTYVRDRNFLYDQQIFPQPPYPFYDVFKAGLRFTPNPQWEVYVDYTRNEFESAGQISDGMNHIGLEVGYLPVPKLGLYLRYTYSRWQDLDRLLEGITKPRGHHNVFGSLRYLPGDDDEFVFEYGVSPNYPLTEMASNDPFGGSLLTIDTQHIVRVYYRRRF